jgi:hypothetical protein
MLEEVVIPIDFGQGIDTKTDPKLVVPGNFLRLENGVFTNPKRIAKRNGYSTLGSGLTAPQMVHGYQNELLAADQNQLYTYSSSQNAWISRGAYVSTELTKYTIDQENAGSGFVDSAALGNYAVYGWSTATLVDSAYPAAYPSKVLGSVVDLSTGAVLTGPTVLSTPVNHEILNPVRCVVLGSTKLAIFYIDEDNAKIICRTVTFSGGGVVSFSSENIVSTNFDLTKPYFDVVNTSSGAALIYINTTGVTLALISTSGTVSSSTSIVDAAVYAPVSVSVNSFNSNIWIYWGRVAFTLGDPSSASIRYAVYTSALVSVLASTSVVTIADPFYVTNMTAMDVSATQQTLFYSIYAVTVASNHTDETKSISVQSNGTVGSAALFAFGVMPYSHPFTIGSDKYAVFLSRGTFLVTGSANFNIVQFQPTFFVVRLTNVPSTTGIPLVVARIGSGLGNSQQNLHQWIGYTITNTLLSSTKALIALSLETQIFLGDIFFTSTAPPSPGSRSGGLNGEFAYTIDFSSANANRAINCGGVVALNGGTAQIYDGQRCTEFGYHLFPEIPSAGQTTDANGHIANGTYSYLAIFQWVDAQGNLHQSAPSEAVQVTTTGMNNAVDVTVSTNYLSQKTMVNIAIYRTTASGTVYFLITNPVFTVAADPSVVSVTYRDLLVDADLAGNPQAYTYPASPVLENSTPPPSMVMVAHNNRLWFVDSENRNTIWYTKSFEPLVGLSPSAFMTEQIDPKYGDITALSEMDEKLVFFKEKGVLAQSGDGVTDTGSGSTLSFPQVIPSDVGCSVLKSVVLTPSGVMFKSINGIYILDRSLNVSYIGMEVESYNSQTITSANLIPGKSQIRFLCSSGLTLVYDYIFKKWSTFTNHTGLSATTWSDLYVYSTGTQVFKEAVGSYLDNATGFALLLQSSWLHIGSVQGFQRVRRLAMLGDYVNGASALHKMQIQIAYDFGSSFSTAVPYTFGSTSSSGVFQYRERLPQQKCDSLSLLIQETVTNDSSEYLDLTNISFEAAVKKGLNKLPAAQSVG